MRGRPAAAVWALAALAVVLVVLATVLFVRVGRAAQEAGPEARDAAARAAADVTVALLTYTPDTVAADQYAAGQLLTGEFRDRYGAFTDSAVVPTARADRITSTASVTASGVSDVAGDSARALVFLTQVTSRDGGDPQSADLGARVDLTRVDGRWLASGFTVS